ncbi:MAG: hypothetical protein GXY83_23900 [Rhodopirellula sp.]|nr:hypothetical protein [Rhodopirellula sp.]
MISLEIERRRITIPAEMQGVVTASSERARYRNLLQKSLASQLRYTETLGSAISETTLKRMVTKYSEQLAFQPLTELRHWFTYRSGAYIEPGYPPLFYGAVKTSAFSPNKSAESAIGEAIAGCLGQRLYRCRKLARPNHDYPDIVMERPDQTYLVEAKATLASREKIRQIADEEIPSMATMVISSKLMDTRPVVGLIVGTFFDSENHYSVCITEIDYDET